MSSERKPTKGLLSDLGTKAFTETFKFPATRAAEAMADAMAEQRRQMFHELLWGSEAPKQPLASGAEQAVLPAKNLPEASDAQRNLKGGRPRKWFKSQRHQEHAIEQARRAFANGKTDREISDALAEIFPDEWGHGRKFWQRIERLRES